MRWYPWLRADYEQLVADIMPCWSTRYLEWVTMR